MKTKTHKNTLILITAICMLFGMQQSNAQLPLEQTFNAAYPNWPTGWTADTGGWFMDTSSSNASYAPTAGQFGYPGASGGAMIDIDNSMVFNTGHYSVTSASYSTLGYDSITIVYGARLTKKFNASGSEIQNLSWSSNGGSTWDSISYTENPNDSYWHLINDSTPIKLPSGASNQSGIVFRWLAYIVPNASGTYRIDDIIVNGKATAGINTVTTLPPVSVYPNPASDFVTISNSNANSIVRIIDVTGKILKTVYISNALNKIDVSDINPGFYFAEISGADNSQPQIAKLAIIR